MLFNDRKDTGSKASSSLEHDGFGFGGTGNPASNSFRNASVNPAHWKGDLPKPWRGSYGLLGNYGLSLGTFYPHAVGLAAQK